MYNCRKRRDSGEPMRGKEKIQRERERERERENRRRKER